MDSIGVRELRQHASRYLDRVAAGESIEVTDRGRPVARLVPISGDPWQDLVFAGEVVEAVEPFDVLEIAPAEYSDGGSAALEALRRDER